MFGGVLNCRTFMTPRLRLFSSLHRHYSSTLETNYTESQKEKILQVLNEDSSLLTRYDITKLRVKKISDFLGKNGEIKSISDIENMEGFTEKTAKKLFKSILDGPKEKIENLNKKIKGQILHPSLSENLRQSCKTVLAVYITVNSVCWVLINRENYVVDEWSYHGIDYPDGKKMQITDILNMAWTLTNNMPLADLYVMKAEATSLRATGSDPNNPKVLGVNLQKAQLVAMMVALINAKNNDMEVNKINETESQTNQELKQKVYFLRPTLPFRLYGTLVGNERVSTDQTVINLLQEAASRESNSHVFVPENLVNDYLSQKELQKDMLGQCLLLALTFMDICIYKNKESINKLLKRTE
ncbi:unnamed protein product, partial [Brenthis ino]